MTFVENFSKTHSCPKCGKNTFIGMHNQDIDVSYNECCYCHEEVYSLKDQDKVVNYEFNVGKAPDDIDDTLMEIEYELYTYEMLASTQHELLMANCMRGILEKFLSVIRRMK